MYEFKKEILNYNTSRIAEPVLFFSLEGRILYANDAAQQKYDLPNITGTALRLEEMYAGYTGLEPVEYFVQSIKNSHTVLLSPVIQDSSTPEPLLWVHYIADEKLPFLIVFEIRQRPDSGAEGPENFEKRVKQLHTLNNRLSKEVTIRKKIEENLQAYADELKSKNEELEQFAYVASHDLQEPLRMVSSFTQLLAQRYQGKLDNDADEFINYIIDGACRMQDLISDLLAYSRVGRKGEAFTPIDMNEVLTLARQNLTLPIDETDALINSEKLPEVYADPRQMVQLMQNLVSNAIKFRREGMQPEISVKYHELPDAWEFSVTDNGIGIEEKHQERVFQIFQRLHTRDRYPGTGIGLAICKKIVERHGGEIGVRSAEGQGATFYFTIKKQETSA